jgi:hypothetical protein
MINFMKWHTPLRGLNGELYEVPQVKVLLGVSSGSHPALIVHVHVDGY